MPSPFPGIDPYIEGHAWETFHATFLVETLNQLTKSVRPRYVVRVELMVYLEHSHEEVSKSVRPDVSVVGPSGPGIQERGGTALAEPVILTLPMPELVEEKYLTVRTREDLELVTVIEVLSPANK